MGAIQGGRCKLPPEARIFRMNGQTLLGGICGTIMGPLFVGLMIFVPEEFSDLGLIERIVAWVMFVGFSFLGPALIHNYLCYAATTKRGLYGYRPFRGLTYLPWSEVHRVTSDEPHKRLIVTDETGQRSVWIEYQFVDFDLISTHVSVSVKAEAYDVPEVQQRYRIGWFMMPLFVVGFFGSIGICFVAYPEHWDGIAAGVVCALMLGKQIVSLVTHVELNPQGIRLKSFLRSKFVPYSEVASVGMEVDHMNVDRTVVVNVILVSGSTIPLKHLTGSAAVLLRSLEVAIEAYETLKARRGA